MAGKKILVAPLDWGLGHATRCIPVIRELLNAGHEVLIAVDGHVAYLLKEEFPQLKQVPLKGYRLTYSSILPAWLKTIFMLPKIIFRMVAEHVHLKKIIRDKKIDVVISDNRFGLWNKNICSVYITHQVMIKCPKGFRIFEPLLHFIHQSVIKKYDYCWIPDYEGRTNLSGDLAHRYPLPENARYINPLSRFTLQQAEKEIEYDLCIILSGPEPSRNEFEKIIMSGLKEYSGKAILILGQPGNKQDKFLNNTRIVSHLQTAELEKIIAASKLIVCRPGYSGVMDLAALKKDAFLVPTPGQTEQEYLAEYLASKKIFASAAQSSFNIKNVIVPAGFSIQNLSTDQFPSVPLDDAIDQLKGCG